MPANPTRFFFYGTLMSEEGRAGALAGLARPVANALCRGDLFAVHGGAFPAMLDGDGVVVGEMWEALDESLVPQILARLDSIEGYREDHPEASMYLRVERTLLAPQQLVWTYVWNTAPTRGYDRMSGLSRIDSGDFRLWKDESRWLAEADRCAS